MTKPEQDTDTGTELPGTEERRAENVKRAEEVQARMDKANQAAASQEADQPGDQDRPEHHQG